MTLLTQWAGVAGDYANDYKMTLIPEAVSRAPFVLPDLGDMFMLRRYPKFAGDPTPEISIGVQRIGGTSAGIQQQFLAREPSLWMYRQRLLLIESLGQQETKPKSCLLVAC